MSTKVLADTLGVTKRRQRPLFQQQTNCSERRVGQRVQSSTTLSSTVCNTPSVQPTTASVVGAQSDARQNVSSAIRAAATRKESAAITVAMSKRHNVVLHISGQCSAPSRQRLVLQQQSTVRRLILDRTVSALGVWVSSVWQRLDVYALMVRTPVSRL